MVDRQKYDSEEIDDLWKLNYRELALALGKPNARMSQARFEMQPKVAWETRLYMRTTTIATVVMALATIVLAARTFIGPTIN